MQASQIAMDGLNAMAPPEILGIRSKSFHRCLLRIDLCLKRQHVLQLRPAVFSDIAKRKITDVHPMDDKWTGNAQDVGRVIWTEFLLLGEDGNPLTLEEGTERGLEQSRSLRRQPEYMILARLAANPDLDLIALTEFTKRLCYLAVLVRELDELQYLGGHGWSFFKLKYRA